MDIIFPMLDYQVKWVISVLVGEKFLPSREEMICDTEDVYKEALEHGIGSQWAGHYIGPAMFDLIEIWAKLGDNKLLPPVYKKVYDDAVYGRLNNIMHYKKTNYYFLDDEKWVAETNELR